MSPLLAAARAPAQLSYLRLMPLGDWYGAADIDAAPWQAYRRAKRPDEGAWRPVPVHATCSATGGDEHLDVSARSALVAGEHDVGQRRACIASVFASGVMAAQSIAAAGRQHVVMMSTLQTEEKRSRIGGEIGGVTLRQHVSITLSMKISVKLPSAARE